LLEKLKLHTCISKKFIQNEENFLFRYTNIYVNFDFAALSAFIDAGVNDIKRYKDYIALNRKTTWVLDNYLEIQEAKMLSLLFQEIP